MKKLFLALFLAMSAMAADAQDVYQAVMISAQDVLDNPASEDYQIKIAQFKITALGYMHRKMVERNPNTPAHDLDVQAYYMSEFVTSFLSDVVKHSNAPEKERKERILNFIQISLSCPMFNDPDKATTEVYISDSDNLTPFCLDTDWKKACEILKAPAAK